MKGSIEMQCDELAEIQAAEFYARQEAQQEYGQEQEYHATIANAGVDPAVIVEEQAMIDQEGWWSAQGEQFRTMREAPMYRRMVAMCRVAGRDES